MDNDTQASYQPRFQWSFLHPRYWSIWLGVLVGLILAFVPFRWRDKLAAMLAKRVAKMNNRGKKRAVINLAHCFPEKSEQERAEILEQSYINAGCLFLGFATIMVRSKKYLAKYIILQNESIITDLVAAGEKVILLVPHAWAIDYPAMLLASRGSPVAAFVNKQSNPLLDWLLNRQRLKYGGRLHTREDGIKPFVRSVRAGFLGYYLPDEDHGLEHSVFVPFLGAQKATLSGIGQLSRLSRAKVVPLIPRYQRETGRYIVEVTPPLSPFPSGCEIDDARIMNEALEKLIREDPTQYMWIMNILRTRPDGSQLY